MALRHGGQNVMEQWLWFALYVYGIHEYNSSSDLPVLNDVSFQKYAKVIFSNGLQNILSNAV